MLPSASPDRDGVDNNQMKAVEDARHLLVGVNEQFCRALRAQADERLDIDVEPLLQARPK